MVSLSPEPDLSIVQEEVKEKPAKPKKEAPKAAKKEEKPKAAPKPEEKVVELKPKEKEAKVKAKAEEEAKVKAEAEAKAQAKAEAEAKAKADAKAKDTEDLKALRYKRTMEREKHEAERRSLEGEKVTKTPASEQFDLVERLSRNIDRIHRRL